MCGHVIFEFKRVGQDFNGVPTPLEVFRLTGGICPACKRHLELPKPEEYRSYIVIRPRILISSRQIQAPIISTPLEAKTTKT
jgi:hypothetical protein